MAHHVLVTTSRLTDARAPVDDTQVSDGSAIALTGSPSDVFVATVTDGDGRLVATQSMRSPCSMRHARQLRVPGNFRTIQAAIDAARPGDTVAVAAGVYHEFLTLQPGVCLVGAGPHHTILAADGEPRSLVDLTSAPGSMVSGFTFRGVTMPAGCADQHPFSCSGNWYAAGIYLGGTTWRDPTQDAPPLIINNIFAGNDVGVMLYWRGVAVIRNNLFIDNRNGFVANHFQSRTLIANNVFFNNRELAIGNQAAYLDIVENVIAHSEIGIAFEYIQTGFIRCNIFFGNLSNSLASYTELPRFTIGQDGNVEIDPSFVEPSGADFHVRPGSPAIDHGCASSSFEPDGSPHDIGVFGGPLVDWVTL